jgi:hypothetical protein
MTKKGYGILGFNPNMKVNAYGDLVTDKPKRQPVAQSTKRAVLIKQKGKCAICPKHLIGSIHYDHIKPVSEGGKSTSTNLRAICASCHDERHILERAKKMDKKKLRSPTAVNLFEIGKIKPFKMPKNSWSI